LQRGSERRRGAIGGGTLHFKPANSREIMNQSGKGREVTYGELARGEGRWGRNLSKRCKEKERRFRPPTPTTLSVQKEPPGAGRCRAVQHRKPEKGEGHASATQNSKNTAGRERDSLNGGGAHLGEQRGLPKRIGKWVRAELDNVPIIVAVNGGEKVYGAEEGCLRNPKIKGRLKGEEKQFLKKERGGGGKPQCRCRTKLFRHSSKKERGTEGLRAIGKKGVGWGNVKVPERGPGTQGGMKSSEA